MNPECSLSKSTPHLIIVLPAIIKLFSCQVTTELDLVIIGFSRKHHRRA